MEIFQCPLYGILVTNMVIQRRFETAAAAEAELRYRQRIEQEREVAARRPGPFNRRKLDFYD